MKKLSPGFSLLEVMIALTIFSIFITTYLTSEGYNLSDSSLLRREIILKQLCEEKIQEIILDPPRFSLSLTLAPQTKSFEKTGFENYQYTVEYKQMTIPDLNKILGNSDDENDDPDSGGGLAQSFYQKMIFDVLKKNMEEMIWQVKVTVVEKGTNFPFSLTSLLTNTKAKLKLNF